MVTALRHKDIVRKTHLFYQCVCVGAGPVASDEIFVSAFKAVVIDSGGNMFILFLTWSRDRKRKGCVTGQTVPFKSFKKILYFCVQVLCEKYWPLERGTVYHGLIQVTTVTRKQGPDYFITTINLRQVSKSHICPPLWHL